MESAGKGSSDVLFTLIKVGAILIIVDAALRLVLAAINDIIGTFFLTRGQEDMPELWTGLSG